MTVARYTLTDEAGTVVNIIEWDGIRPFDPKPLKIRLWRRGDAAPEPARDDNSIENRLARLEAQVR